MTTSIALFEGGTVGLLNGTAVSVADAETNPFNFAALNATVSVKYRTLNASNNDPGQNSSGQFTVTLPNHIQGYTGATWQGSTLTCATAVGANKEMLLRQTELSGTAALNIEVATGGVSFVVGTRVGAPTIAASESDLGEVSVSWDAVASADGYQVQYKLHADTEWTSAADVSSPSVITGLTRLSAYDFRVRAYSELGAGAWDTEESFTPSVYWSDTFGDASLDTGLWTELTATNGTITESGGLVVMDGTSEVASLAKLYADLAAARTTRSGVFTVQMVQHAGADIAIMWLSQNSAGSDEYVFIVDLQPTNAASNAKKARLRYYDSSAVVHYYDGSTWQAASTYYLPNSAGEHIYEDGDVLEWKVTLNHVASTATLAVKHVGNDYTTTVALDYSALRDDSGDALWFAAGDNTLTQKRYVKLTAASYLGS